MMIHGVERYLPVHILGLRVLLALPAHRPPSLTDWFRLCDIQCFDSMFHLDRANAMLGYTVRPHHTPSAMGYHRNRHHHLTILPLAFVVHRNGSVAMCFLKSTVVQHVGSS